MIECFRKLVLVGLALFFAEQGSLAQTAVALMIVFLLAVIMKGRLVPGFQDFLLVSLVQPKTITFLQVPNTKF